MRISSLFLLGLMALPVSVVRLAEAKDRVERNQDSVEELIRQALALRAKGNFLGAMDLLERARIIDPRNLDVHFYIGLTQYNLADMPGAEFTLRSILRAEPRYVDAKIILGRVLLAQGKLYESEKLLREAIEQTPEYIDAYDALASNLAAQKKIDEAIFVLDTGLRISPDDVQLLVKKGKLLFIDKKSYEAERVADQLILSHETVGRYQGRVLKAKIIFDANPTRFMLAEYQLMQAIEISPEEVEAHVVLSDLYASFWKFEESQRVLEKALTKVTHKEAIEAKLDEVKALSQEVKRFSVSMSASNWSFDDNRAGWQEFYLDGVWRIDPYKTVVLGFENYTRDDIADQTLRVEYSQKLNKWIYVYAAGRFTANPDFRERDGVKVGTSFVTNPLPVGASVISTEVESRHYETGRVYFLNLGVEQYIGRSFILNAKVFRVISQGKDFNVWSAKLTWNVNDRFQIYGGYGTMTEDVSGRLISGHSYNLGGQYRINNRFSFVGNYTRHSNDAYKADQVTFGIKFEF